MRKVSLDLKYDRYDRSRIATCLWCVWSLCLSVSGSMFRHPAKGIRVILWFFFWLYNSHLTAEIVQGRIRDSRPPPLPLSFCLIWTKTWSSSFLFVSRPPKSLLVSHFLSYLSFSVSPEPQFLPRCVCGDSGVKLRWVKPGPVSHAWTNPWHKHLLVTTGLSIRLLIQLSGQLFSLLRGLFFSPASIVILKGQLESQ